MAEALYRKYRPQIFEDVVGQEQIERTIKNAIEQDKVSHAYLFCGPRGTGKTTTARLLAKALLCGVGKGVPGSMAKPKQSGALAAPSSERRSPKLCRTCPAEFDNETKVLG